MIQNSSIKGGEIMRLVKAVGEEQTEVNQIKQVMEEVAVEEWKWKLDSLDEGSNDLAHPPLMGVRPVARWHRSRDGPLDEELMERNDSDWMMSGSGMRRYRQHRASG
uniref:Uncharacterized protein n=1 Tax=Meloidogyne javanica TaxID=6303 RepID=A0A915N3F8_MELJA